MEDGWQYSPKTMPLQCASIYLLHPSIPPSPNPAVTPGEHSCWTGRTSSRRTGHAGRSSSIPAAPQQGGGSLLLCRALLFSISPNQGMTWQTGSIPSEHWVQHAPASAAAPSTQGPSGGERDGWDCGAPRPLKMPPTSSQHSKQPYLHLTQPGPAGWRREVREGKQLEIPPQCYLLQLELLPHGGGRTWDPLSTASRAVGLQRAHCCSPTCVPLPPWARQLGKGKCCQM